MDFKSIYDAVAGTIKMAGRLGASDGIFRPVHHSEPLTIQTSVTRPANTTPYAVGAAIGATSDVKFTFDIGFLNVPAALLVGARLVRNSTTNGTVAFRAFIHDAVPGTLPSGDGALFPQLWTNRPSRRGWIDFPTSMAGVAGGSDCLEYAGILSSGQGIPLAPATGVITVIIQTLAAFTPTSGEAWTIELDFIV